jgi:hypothetical protein
MKWWQHSCFLFICDAEVYLQTKNQKSRRPLRSLRRHARSHTGGRRSHCGQSRQHSRVADSTLGLHTGRRQRCQDVCTRGGCCGDCRPTAWLAHDAHRLRGCPAVHLRQGCAPAGVRAGTGCIHGTCHRVQIPVRQQACCFVRNKGASVPQGVPDVVVCWATKTRRRSVRVHALQLPCCNHWPENPLCAGVRFAAPKNMSTICN